MNADRHLDEEDLHDEVRSFVRRQVALADLPAAAIVAETMEYLDGDADAASIEALAWTAVTEELDAHLAAQAGWPDVTDSDRLTAAFRSLSAAGIVARENFACCQNCGLGEIAAEVPDCGTSRGYAFYHQQDADHAAEGSALFIAYGLFERPPSVEIGHEVTAALRAEGLTVHWNGGTGSRIQVPLTWRRRRVGRLAASPPVVDDDLDVELEVLGTWTGRYAPRAGAQSAERLAALHLPWMPAATHVRLATDAGSVTVRREGDRLIGAYDDPQIPTVTVDRYAAMALVRRLHGYVGSPTADAGGDFLEVTYQLSRDRGTDVALESAEAAALARQLQPHTRDFLSCVGRSGGVVQMQWQGSRLWLETPDPATATSRGRHVTVAEAERMITILGTEDRVAVEELGDLVTESW